MKNKKIDEILNMTPGEKDRVRAFVQETPYRQVESQIEKRAAETESHPYLDALWGEGKFRDSGRKSSGYAEALDSILGAPARQAIHELQEGNVDNFALERVLGRIGSDPKNSPDSVDIAMKATDNPYLGAALATAVDVGAQIPANFIPGTPAIIKGVKDPGKGMIADAAEAFAERGKAAPSTEAKIAAMHGQTGEVRDVVPRLIDEAEETHAHAQRHGVDMTDLKTIRKSAFDNPRNAPPKVEPRKTQYKNAFWEGDDTYTDDAKDVMTELANRFGKDAKKFIKTLEGVQEPYSNMPYAVDPDGKLTGLPNFAATPTGVIGAPGVSHHKTNPDPFSWIDSKFGAGKQLLLRHKSMGLPAEIHTSSDLIGRDDYVPAIPEGSTVNMYMLTPDESLNRILFPGNPSQLRLSKAADALEAKGVKVNRVYPTADSLWDGFSEKQKHYVKSQFGTRDSFKSVVQKKIDDGLAMKGVTPIGKAKGTVDNYAFGGVVQPQNMAEGGVVQGYTNVLNPDGEVVSLPNNELQAAFKEGYQAAPKELIEQARLKRDYGTGFGNELLATGAGALRGATLGLSDLAMVNSGIADASTLQALKEFNPNASVVGEIGGAAAALFTPSGPIALIGKAGKATAQGVKALKAANLAKDSSTAAKVLGAAESIGATAAGSAVEGALYTGIGNSITEYSLGDPNLNGEKILANFGHGAFWGGVLGGALKGAVIGVPEGVSAAKNGIKKIRDYVFGTGHGDEGKILGLLDKVDPEMKLSDAMRNRAITLDVDQRASLIDNVTSELNSVKRNIDTSIKKLNDTIRPAEVEALIDTSAPMGVVQSARQGVISAMDEAIGRMKAEPHIFDPGPTRHLELARDAIVKGFAKEQTPGKIFERLKSTRQALGDIVYDKMSAKATASREVIDDVMGQVRKAIQDPDTFGLVGSSQSAHDEILSKLYDFVSPRHHRPTVFQKTFMKKSGYGPKAKWEFDRGKIEKAIKNSEKDPQTFQMLDDYFDVLHDLPDHLESTFANVPNSLWDATKFSEMPGILAKANMSVGKAQVKYMEAAQNMKGRTLGMGDLLPGAIATQLPIVGAALQAYNIATRPIEYINKLAAMERIIGKTTNAIGRGAKSIFDPAIKLAEKPKAPIFNLAYDEKVDKYRQLSEQFAEFTNNSDAAIARLNDATGHIQDVMPDGVSAMQLAAITGSQFLSSKIPFPPHENPFSKPYIPSATELADFEHYMEIVENPVDALSSVRRGTLTPATVETLQIVYPKLYEEMKARVMDTAMDVKSKGGEIPFKVKQSLSLFFGHPIDEILSPASIQANQMAFIPKVAQQPNFKPTGMTLAQRTKTKQDRPE